MTDYAQVTFDNLTEGSNGTTTEHEENEMPDTKQEIQETEHSERVTERRYYSIDENTAKLANDMNSLREYKEGSATDGYRYHVDFVYDIVDTIKEKKPTKYDKAVNMADRYSRKLAEYYNDYYKNEASCPSVLISGGSNFPTKKKDAQNSRRETLHETWEYLEGYRKKIENILYHTQPILSSEDDAIEQLQDKLESLETLQSKMKEANAYYKKNKTLDGCPCLTEKEIEACKEGIESQWHFDKDKVFLSWELSNNNANIRRIKQRIEDLKAVKEQGTQESENEFCSVVENTELMRLQLFFDGKPDANVREILKKYGFKWSPKNEAWQRQLTNNARNAWKYALKELEALGV